MRRVFLASAAFAAVLSGHALAASALAPPPPGYKPAPNSEEAGLWAVMDKEEIDVQRSPALLKDEALNAYVKDIVCSLAGENCSSLRVYIVDEPTSNAMTAPNGMVIVWTGLLLRAENEAELAFVLAHEITHYLKRHTLLNFQKTTRTAGTVAFLSAATVGLGGLLAVLPALGMLAAYSRDQEREADDGGFDLAVARGYDPRQGATFMAHTAEEEDANTNRKPTGYLADHPAPKERLATMTKRADEIQAKTRADKIGKDEYHAVIRPFRARWLEEEFNRGNYSQSLVMIKQLVKAEPDAGDLNYALGEAYRRRNAKGDSENAMTAYRAAIETMSAPAAVHRGLGLVALKAGNKAAAREAFEQYLSLAPDAKDRATIQYYLTAAGAPP